MKNKTITLLALIISLVLGILLLREYHQKSDTLDSGVSVSVLITKINCPRRRSSKIEFTYKNKTYYSSIKRNTCRSLSVGDSLDLLHIEGTNCFVELDESLRGELLATITAFSCSLLLIVYSIVQIKKKST